MNRVLAYGYLLVGFVMGSFLGIGTEREPNVIFQRFWYFLAAFVLIFLYQLIEDSSHKRYLSKWITHRQQGKWYFITTHYILARGITILLIFSVPLLSRSTLSGDSILILALTALVALLLFGFLGYQEWSRCQEDSAIQALRDAAERAKQLTSSLPNGGGN